MVKLVQRIYYLLKNFNQQDEDFVEAYSFMGTAQKINSHVFVQQIMDSKCDEYLIKNDQVQSRTSKQKTSTSNEKTSCRTYCRN